MAMYSFVSRLDYSMFAFIPLPAHKMILPRSNDANVAIVCRIDSGWLAGYGPREPDFGSNFETSEKRHPCIRCLLRSRQAQITVIGGILHYLGQVITLDFCGPDDTIGSIPRRKSFETDGHSSL
jgi:hypothetical protein